MSWNRSLQGNCETSTAAPFCRGLPCVMAHMANCSSDRAFFPSLHNISHPFSIRYWPWYIWQGLLRRGAGGGEGAVLRCILKANPTAWKPWLGGGQDGIGCRVAIGMFYEICLFDTFWEIVQKTCICLLAHFWEHGSNPVELEIKAKMG